MSAYQMSVQQQQYINMGKYDTLYNIRSKYVVSLLLYGSTYASIVGSILGEMTRNRDF